MYDIFPKFIYYRKRMFPTSLQKTVVYLRLDLQSASFPAATGVQSARKVFIFAATGVQSARKRQWFIIRLFARRLVSSLLAKDNGLSATSVKSARKRL